ncbi:hypothetical protein MKX03_029178, partial [Papaver bracteatum]
EVNWLSLYYLHEISIEDELVLLPLLYGCELGGVITVRSDLRQVLAYVGDWCKWFWVCGHVVIMGETEYGVGTTGELVELVQ